MYRVHRPHVHRGYDRRWRVRIRSGWQTSRAQQKETGVILGTGNPGGQIPNTKSATRIDFGHKRDDSP